MEQKLKEALTDQLSLYLEIVYREVLHSLPGGDDAATEAVVLDHLPRIGAHAVLLILERAERSMVKRWADHPATADSELRNVSRYLHDVHRELV